jgi:hypothetical protein
MAPTASTMTWHLGRERLSISVLLFYTMTSPHLDPPSLLLLLLPGPFAKGRGDLQLVMKLELRSLILKRVTLLSDFRLALQTSKI